MFGLLELDLEYIQMAMKKFNEIDRAVIFGSRAMGNFKKGSDVDISIYGQNITNETLYRLNDLLNEEYPLPYFFDILHYEGINNINLKNHIDTYGSEVYKKMDSNIISKVIKDS
ncbi:nucleotidyltransferase family protein [Robertmurraya sp. FSL R5-0851]|uniref:nucleotidyltransferase family protein n=1 Tax=Robertmurraya sp. FSL R5-0851 TaxID=2921584 RepID=UPI0030F7F56B